MNEELRWAVALLGAAAVLYVPALVFNFAFAPSRMEEDAKAEAASLLSTANDQRVGALEENKLLKEEKVPKINAVPGTGRREMARVGPHLMWAKLEILNTSPTISLTNVQVRLVSCESINRAQEQTQDGPEAFVNLGAFMWDWSPIMIFWDSSGSETTNIPGGTSRTAIVAFSNDSNGPPAVFNDVAHTPGYNGLKIRVEISSPDSAALHGDYYLECHGNMWNGPQSHMEFKDWDEWASTRTIIEQPAPWLESHTEDSQNEEAEQACPETTKDCPGC
ncbi:MAG: hypothetical protein IH963_12650 [Chloroflexi bacterium]|nr:hypothetical protein [Chloroflexota bacterium]